MCESRPNGKNHLGEVVGVASAVSNGVPDLVLDALYPRAQCNALFEFGSFSNILETLLQKCQPSKQCLTDSNSFSSLSLFTSVIKLFTAPDQCAALTESAYCCTQPGLRALLLASKTGTHGVWNPGRESHSVQKLKLVFIYLVLHLILHNTRKIRPHA